MINISANEQITKILMIAQSSEEPQSLYKIRTLISNITFPFLNIKYTMENLKFGTELTLLYNIEKEHKQLN